MNFLPTRIKTFLTLVAFVLSDFYLASLVTCEIPLGLGDCSPWYVHSANPIIIFTAILPAALFYVIFSFAQGK